jgi:flagellin
MISINTNPAANAAAYSLDNVSRNLQKTLTRLSSGSRIVNAMDDAGGLAVSMRLSAAVRRTEATQNNVSNAQAFLETQDGVLKSAEKVVNRLGELTQLGTDVTKSTSDLALYQAEVNSLKAQLGSLISESFNGVSLFTSGSTGTEITAAGTVSIVASQDGTQTINITKRDLSWVGHYTGTQSSDSAGMINVTSITSAKNAITAINGAIQAIATLRANNGAEQSRLGFAADVLAVNKTNLESAASRITEVDIAQESAKLARFTILQQAGTAMLAQANQSSGSLLRLLS